MIALIKELQPQFYPAALEYLNGNLYRGYNCYVLKKDLFFQLCEFQFSILFEIEKTLDTTGYDETLLRTPAYLGEILYGIFMFYIEKQGNYSIKEQQLIFFNHTERTKGKKELISRYLSYRTDEILRMAADPLLPIGSRRREFLKRIFHLHANFK